MSEDAFSQLKQEPMRREGLSEKVLHRILGLIRSGNLEPGDRLPSERSLMEIFGVSRPPIREALSALSILGVIESRHGGGTIVTDLDAYRLLGPLDFFLSLADQNIVDVFDCRRLNECEAAARAAKSPDQEAKKELLSLLSAQKQTQDAVAFRIADKEFHEKISNLAGNKMLTRINDGLYNLGLDIRREATESSETVQKSIKEHEAITMAILSENAEQAHLMMKQHLDSIERSTLDVLDNKTNA